MDLLFGTTNPGKLRELRRLVADLPIRVVSPEDLGRALPEVEEDGATFRENAEKKAREWAAWAGVHALADDSGLCVDALDGAPGVHSARWSELDPGAAPASPVCELAGAAAAELGPAGGRAARDERNNDKLLRLLAGVPDERRGGRYEAVIAVAAPDGRIVASVTGTCPGRIGHARRGIGGFGYDPLFVPEAERERAGAEGRPAQTMAELAPEEKDALSHRGEAFRKARPALAKLATP
jgi:XTP/dITP diphosphohydrolase